MTLVWHTDDLKVSHMDSFDITNIAVYLYTISIGIMIHQVKAHNYLGMDLDYSKKLIVKVLNMNYLRNILK